jgi:hypothetical protein
MMVLFLLMLVTLRVSRGNEGVKKSVQQSTLHPEFEGKLTTRSAVSASGAGRWTDSVGSING